MRYGDPSTYITHVVLRFTFFTLLRLVCFLIEDIEPNVMAVHHVPHSTLTFRAHEICNPLILVIRKREKHVEVALDTAGHGTFRYNTDATTDQPGEDNLRGSLAMCGGD